MLLAGALLIVLLVVGTYTFLPPLVEGYVARDLQGRLGLSETPEVDLTSDPAPRMLLGEFADGRVVLPPSGASNVRPDEVAIDLNPFDVDVAGSVMDGGLRTASPLTGDLRVELSEAEVNRIASSQVTSYPITGVDLMEGGVLVGSEVSVFGFPIPVGAEGGVQVQDNSLVFSPTRVEAFGSTVPEEVSAGLLEGASFVYPLGEQFGGSVVTGAELREDQVVLTGELGTLALG